MFAGRAIVATDVGEIRSTLDNGRAGVIVPPANAAALAAAIHSLLTNPGRAEALARCARDRARSEYDVANMVRQYGAMYHGLLADARTPISFNGGASQKKVVP
jgi:glycosyltransferase involved in cell wall biosynthesis